jgi:hypothetical protein
MTPALIAEIQTLAIVGVIGFGLIAAVVWFGLRWLEPLEED